MEDHKKNSSSKIDNIKSSSVTAALEHSKKSSLPQSSDRPLCSTSFNTSTEQYSFENQSSSSSFGSEHHHHHHHNHQHVIDSHLSYDIEDDIINMDDDESNHSYVYLQSQQHYTPPPVEFQEGSTPQHQPSLIKKGSIMRNNPELMKRNRQNNSSYELSQDLLDKQIELLERKYGGIRARKAAICIQRAFRHYKMVRKFASITAMAKADKRISNRCSMQSLISVSEQESSDLGISQAGQKVCAIISATPPGQPRSSSSANRAVSFRERRNVLDSNFNQVAPVVKRQPLSQSNFQQQHPSQTSQPPHSHAYVNLLHSQDQQYNNYQNYHSHNNSNNNNYASNNSSLNNSSLHQYDLNISSSSANTTMNSSWNSYSNSPNASLIAQQQYYVRPRTSSISNKKVPPEVPKRTSSIQPPPQSTPPQKYPQQAYAAQPSSRGHHHHHHHHHHHAQMKGVAHPQQQQFYKTENGNHSSPDSLSLSSNSPIPNHSHWQNQTSIEQQTHILHQQYILEQKHIQQQLIQQQNELQLQAKLSETIRKRQYRIGLNLFNKKPEKGITYLMHKNFLENSPHAVSKFLISRKGLSRQMIGEYLGNLQQPFNMAVLEYFAEEMDCSGLEIDVALRKFQGYFRMPGEAQKIERLMEVFSQRYAVCNPDVVGKLRSPDTIFVLAFAIIMLNTDLHTPNIKADRRMKCEDFIKNLRGIDDCMDIDKKLLIGIYERIKETEFKTASDHVTQVMKVQKTIVGKKLNLAVPHRRLVCYCRLYEIDINKKERQGLHQREVFLFNDLLVVTKILTKKKASVTYTFRNSFSLVGLVVTLLDVPNYPFCIRLSQKADKKVLATFNARNEHDRCKFADDLRESIAEMDEMESIRIEMELERQMKATRCVGNGMNNNVENRDSGVGDIESLEFNTTSKSSSFDTKSTSNNDIQNGQLKRGGALSNSLLDIHDQFGNECRQRRGSVGSLDSGMSISFQSSNNNNNASNCKNAENSASSTTNTSTYVSQTVVHRQQLQPQHANGHAMAIPALLPNSALYQYNNEQMIQMHELYEEHSRTHTDATGRSTDV